MEKLFEIENNLNTLTRFVNRMEARTPVNDFESTRDTFITLVTSSMKKEPSKWDEFCQINIGWIGSNFIESLTLPRDEWGKSELDDICSSCFRFLLEFDLSVKSELPRGFEMNRRKIFAVLEQFDEQARNDITFATHEMPTLIFKDIANSVEIQSLKNFKQVTDDAKSLKQSWEEELEQKRTEVEKLKGSLENYRNAFNFVGLYDGFNDLYEEKKRENKSIRFWMISLAVLIVSIICAEVLFIYSNSADIERTKTAIALSLFPMVSLIAILIYYFRVLLVNYKSVKSQLLQISLRKTLCRFIQHYADYSSELKSKDQNSLAKFESIIFSGIVGDDEKLPSTYDGLEQFGKFIKNLK
ncbi:hypothetical protein OPW32_16935 [Vibrio europaeus]|uniref:hypothetical protein n=1 Tax=Vibrio europaeus TaxID=300876 RepID=UPI00234126F6|nr:hypothetical protein [Vibrio europaeus]MDC5850881.1 hypothetical protein [Vibrio europaeus]